MIEELIVIVLFVVVWKRPAYWSVRFICSGNWEHVPKFLRDKGIIELNCLWHCLIELSCFCLVKVGRRKIF